MAHSSVVIEARNLAKQYSINAAVVSALRGVDLRIDRGEYLAILGPSGSGKSTMLQLLGGLDHPSSGTVRLLGTDLADLNDRELTRFRLTTIGFVFQRFHLLPVLTAVENVELPMAEAGRPRGQRLARARELLGYVGLASRAQHRATELSGGEMQRVAIARALANEPALILADEPTGELDQATGGQILELFDRLHRDGATIVVVTHDEHLAARAGRQVRMLDGRIDSDTHG
ncbi:MAG: ABC transporter ATP-binding protein [Gemmatimonadetes bacterium]|nr:ABC transporter ATP-binding protein [Gemmatimonadota bacterium]